MYNLMCGFIGFITDIKNKENSLIYKKFDFYFNELKKRGPDFSQVKKIIYKSKIIQLGFVRLAIQDLNEKSNKIFYDNDRIILFNGEIYNVNTLKQKYFNEHNFDTNSDTELLFELYKKKGKGILNELRGIFSIVFINLKDETIQLIRDFTGTKPLYYLKNADSLYFSSEAWFLYSLSNKKINNECLNFFINYGFTEETQTLIESVKKVPPRKICEFKLVGSEYKTEEYYNIDKNKNDTLPSKEEVNSLIVGTIEKNLISDTKIGTFLSGGVDSTTISLIAKKRNDNVEAFTTCYLPKLKYEKFNIDFQYAKKISNDYNIKLNVHYEENEKNLYEDFIKVTDYMDEPVSNLNFLNTYWQTKLAKEKNIKVVLTGDGADEIFCGYDRYRSAYISSKLKPLSFISKKISTYTHLKKNQIPNHFYSIFKNYNYSILFKPQIKRDNLFKISYFDKLNTDSLIDNINYFDMKYWLSNESNYKLDKCSMINSIEARVPFQDADLINKFFSISNEKKFSLFNRKYILKNIGVLPKYILNRPKIGWFSPERIFLDTHLNDIIKDFFTESKIRNQNIFDYINLVKFFEEYPKKTYKIKRQILTIVLFQIWYDKILNLE